MYRKIWQPLNDTQPSFSACRLIRFSKWTSYTYSSTVSPHLSFRISYVCVSVVFKFSVEPQCQRTESIRSQPRVIQFKRLLRKCSKNQTINYNFKLKVSLRKKYFELLKTFDSFLSDVLSSKECFHSVLLSNENFHETISNLIFYPRRMCSAAILVSHTI